MFSLELKFDLYLKSKRELKSSCLFKKACILLDLIFSCFFPDPASAFNKVYKY